MWRDSNEWFHSCINWITGAIEDRVAANSQNKVVRQFRGLSLFKNINTVPMDHATGLLNVFTNASGALEKVRLPFTTTAPTVFPIAGAQNIDTFYDFQQANGTRQLVFGAGPSIGCYIATVVGGVETLPWVFHNIEDNNALDNARWSWKDSNNVLYGANGKRVVRYDGGLTFAGSFIRDAGFGRFGINPPAPTIGVRARLTSIQRTANVTTFTVSSDPGFSSVFPHAGAFVGALEALSIGTPITIGGVAGGPLMNGGYYLTAIPGGFQGSYSNPGVNAGPFINDGYIIVPYVIQQDPSPGSVYKIFHITRSVGNLVITLQGNFTTDENVRPGDQVVISGLTAGNADANGTWIVKGVTFFPGLTFTIDNTGLPDIATNTPAAGEVKVGPTNTLSGRKWRYAWSDSQGVVGPASDPSPTLPGGGLIGPYRAFLETGEGMPFGANQTWWFATADGGGDYELEFIENIQGGAGYLQPHSTSVAEISLDETQLAPIINYAPPIGSKLERSQGRLYLAGIVDDPTAIAYSAFDQYLVGERPEEAWFPNNRLRLPTGADPIQAFGVILPGVVAFSRSNEMFMFKGQVEDITTSLPVNFSAILEQMPWKTGAVAQTAIQSTPYGIVWVASDLTVKIWNGVFYGDIIGPRDLTENIYPLMRRITPGQEENIQSAFFNYVERDWFAISVCLDGATTPNYLVFFDLAQDANDNLGAFIAQPTIPIGGLGVREDNNGARHLIMSNANQFYELRVASEMVNGIITNAVPATGGVLTAYWQSGLVGSDTPYQMKMFRWGRLITDSAAAGFNLVATLVDDNKYTFVAPLSRVLKFIGQKFTVNYKARRAGVTVMFPSQDASVAVQELSIRYNPAGEH